MVISAHMCMHTGKHTHMYICTQAYMRLQPPLLIGLLHLAAIKIGIDLSVHENRTVLSSSGDRELLGQCIGMCNF